jgi:hypothetical protein
MPAWRWKNSRSHPRQRAGARLNRYRDQPRILVDAWRRKTDKTDFAAPGRSDLDGAIMLLVSNASRYMTGSVVTVDGGLLLA